MEQDFLFVLLSKYLCLIHESAADAQVSPLVVVINLAPCGCKQFELTCRALRQGLLGLFLYLALRALKDLEHKANLDAETIGLHRQISIEASPANVLGIELNPYAAELARVTVWIGEIQWMLKNGYPIRNNLILQPLGHIENRDAVLNADGSEAQWPGVDAIIGNPPFLGGSEMRSELGDDYTEALRKCYADRVSGGADLVTYWFEKARAQIEAANCQRAGLVATQSVRKGSNQKVLARICDTTDERRLTPIKSQIYVNR